jgi:large subunit ribosomal protein L10
MERKKKEKIVKELAENFQNYPELIFTNFQGLSVSELFSLRKALRKGNAFFKVVKNRLARQVVTLPDEILKGPTGIIFIKGEFPEVAKILHEFSQEHPQLKIKAGRLSQKIISQEEISKMATLPSREELIRKTIWLLNVPRLNLLQVLQAPLRKLVYLLEKIKEQKS